MLRANKAVVWGLVLMSILAFFVLAAPNATGSADRNMVSIFEPDEAAILDVVARMSSPAPDLRGGVHAFFNYDFYHYGFPFFGSAGLVGLAFREADQFGNIPALMLALRQLVSVVPMLTGLLILVWLHDHFQSWRSLALYGLLLIVPATSMNGTWLHPDGLVLLLTALILLMLWKDQGDFGKFFYFAAALCGVLTAAKLVGVYFFLTIAVLLIWGMRQRRLNFRQAVGKGILFLIVMGGAFVLANPFLLHRPSLRLYLFTLKSEFEGISAGYGLVYETGLAASLPVMTHAYGQVYFLLLAIIGMVMGVLRGPRRFLHALLLTWSIPLTVMVLSGTHFKYQYWLPVALPLISCIAWFFPGSGVEEADARKPAVPRFVQILVAGLVLYQAGQFVQQDFSYLRDRAQREQNNPIIQAYDGAAAAISALDGQELKMYHDYRLYVPLRADIHLETSFDMLQQGYMDEHDFDLIYVSKQRIRDYMNPDAQGLNPDQLSTSRVFYNKLETNTLPGYRLAFEDPYTLLFVRESLCPQLPSGTCR